MTGVGGNLLREPVIRVQTDRGPCGMSLPEVLHALGEGTDVEFPGLRPFQHHSWQAFLTQLAAVLADRGYIEALSASVDEWAEGLRKLTNDAEEPWSLIVVDQEKPAFMQVPVREQERRDYKKTIAAPDDIDLLVKRTKHSVKARRIRHPQPDHWLYALVSVQTGGGYPGRGYKEVSRMNGGYGNRPGVTFANADRWCDRFATEVDAWVNRIARLCQDYGYSARGTSLLWLDAWDGKTSIAVPTLHPAYIEICRRIRLTRLDQETVALIATNMASRVETGDRHGDTGDLWTPIRTKDGAALTVGSGGFRYQLMRDIMFGAEYESPMREAQSAAEWQPSLLVGRALARGQGKTEGYHHRAIRIPTSGARYVFLADERARADALSIARVQRASDAWRRLLRPAICVLLQGAPSKLDLSDDRAEAWRDRMQRRVDAVFFESLWADLGSGEDEASVSWDRTLVETCEELLHEGMISLPISHADRYRVLAKSESLFLACRWKHFRETVATSQRTTPGEENADDES